MSCKELTLETMKAAATDFSRRFSNTPLPDLYGTTDGKAVGTYVEHAFKDALSERYSYDHGNSALGIDLPSVNTDIKVTSIRQPQSSAPFKSARQELAGLGYNLLVFVYEKNDDDQTRTAHLDVQHVIFIDKEHTADYRHSKAVRDIVLDPILNDDAKIEQLSAYFDSQHIPLDEYQYESYAKRLIANPPLQGAITISRALQWRFGFKTAIRVAATGQYPGKVVELA